MFAGSTSSRGGEPAVVSLGEVWRGIAGLGMVRLGKARTTHATASRRFDSSGVSPWLGMARQCWARYGSDGRAQAWSGKVTRVPDCGGSTPPTRAGVRHRAAGSGWDRQGVAMPGTARRGYPHNGLRRFDSFGVGCGTVGHCMAGSGLVWRGSFGARLNDDRVTT